MPHRHSPVMIFGASGFIGGYLYGRFSRDGIADVRGHSSMSCNLLSLETVRSVMSSASRQGAVVIASAITRYDGDPYEGMTRNLQMVENICRALAETPVAHVTLLSTIDVYGMEIGPGVKIDESLCPNPGDYYSVSKIASEYLLKQLCANRSIPLTILRLPGVYGPGDQCKSTIGVIASRVLAERGVVIYGPGDDLRDFVYVDDVYRVITSAIQSRKDVMVNLTTGSSFTILELVEVIAEVLSAQIDIRVEDAPSIVRNLFSFRSKKRQKVLDFVTRQREKYFLDVQMTDLRTGITHYLEYVKSSSNH